MLHSKTALLFASVLLLTAVGCGPDQDQPIEGTTEPAPATAAGPEEVGPTAAATLHGREGTTIAGEATFTDLSDGTVRVVVHVVGVDGEGLHGFHLHETGDCSAADFSSAGGHFNPTGAIHGAPDSAEHHAGDLGNIEILADGSAHVELIAHGITVGEGEGSVVGRSVILHEAADDYQTQPTGAAGGRLACGVIQLGEDGGGEDEEPGLGAADESGGPA